MSTLKMFVWEDVLTDYTSGLACAIAYDREEAIKVIEIAIQDKWGKSIGLDEIKAKEPLVFKKPKGVIIFRNRF